MIRRIPNSILGTSEPNPMWFGNPGNEAGNPHWTHPNWLKSRFHFSFAEYNNLHNTGFGVLRVLNDDLVQPKRGFGEHPHANMEICTYVVEGQLTHRDSMGTEETLSRGAIQFMTAGRGVRHQEHNLHQSAPLRFLQIWITPRRTGLNPNYGSAACPPESRLNQWGHMVSDVENPSAQTAVKINQDANIFATEVEAGRTVTMEMVAGRQGYLVCVESSAAVSFGGKDSTTLERHDAAEVYGGGALTVEAVGEKAHLLLIEMAHTGHGRTDL